MTGTVWILSYGILCFTVTVEGLMIATLWRSSPLSGAPVIFSTATGGAAKSVEASALTEWGSE